jgi:hypothetical protein
MRVYDGTSAESDMYTPSRHGRLLACDAPITNGYRIVANLHRIQGQSREFGLRQVSDEDTGALTLGVAWGGSTVGWALDAESSGLGVPTLDAQLCAITAPFPAGTK